VHSYFFFFFCFFFSVSCGFNSNLGFEMVLPRLTALTFFFSGITYFFEGLTCLGGFEIVRPFSSVKGLGLGFELGLGFGLFLLLILKNLLLQILG
tara:strand:- start:466 stop:750 length:285 start_codon:yes stop_codon:yes gene_type:complete